MYVHANQRRPCQPSHIPIRLPDWGHNLSKPHKPSRIPLLQGPPTTSVSYRPPQFCHGVQATRPHRQSSRMKPKPSRIPVFQYGYPYGAHGGSKTYPSGSMGFPSGVSTPKHVTYRSDGQRPTSLSPIQIPRTPEESQRSLQELFLTANDEPPSAPEFDPLDPLSKEFADLPECFHTALDTSFSEDFVDPSCEPEPIRPEEVPMSIEEMGTWEAAMADSYGTDWDVDQDPNLVPEEFLDLSRSDLPYPNVATDVGMYFNNPCNY